MIRTAQGLMIVLTISISAACGAGDLEYSNKWRIECSGDAESDGAIQLRVTPKEGKPTTVSVQVEDGRSENGVARDIRDALRKQLPPGTYDVETDDGEDVLLKKNFNEPNFAIELVSSSVEDVRIVLDRE
jgi:hypothetical protein